MRFTTAIIVASSVYVVGGAPTAINTGADDVILHGRGLFTVMKRSDLQELEAARNSRIAPPKPRKLEESLVIVSGNEVNSYVPDLTKRGGDIIIIPDPSARFLGWDELMSAVVKGAPTTIAVSSGYSIANSITVEVSSQVTLIKEYLTASTHID